MSKNPQSIPTTVQAPTPSEAEAMAKYGILRATVNYYHLGEFRYTSLQDAIAQAKRAG